LIVLKKCKAATVLFSVYTQLCCLCLNQLKVFEWVVAIR